jgi:hypothetical protein
MYSLQPFPVLHITELCSEAKFYAFSNKQHVQIISHKASSLYSMTHFSYPHMTIINTRTIHTIFEKKNCYLRITYCLINRSYDKAKLHNFRDVTSCYTNIGIGLVVRVPGYRTEMNCVSYEIRTEFIYVM